MYTYVHMCTDSSIIQPTYPQVMVEPARVTAAVIIPKNQLIAITSPTEVLWLLLGQQQLSYRYDIC